MAMNKKWGIGIMLMAMCAMVSFAQETKTTTAQPISNGCGSEGSPASRTLAPIGKAIDAVVTGTSRSQQTQSCDQHDKDYYFGVDKKTADSQFTQRSPVMGTAVESFPSKSQSSYDAAQKDRHTSQRLQPTWEQENKACLDSQNYRVE